MGWSEEQTLAQDLAYLAEAHAGRVEMLRAIFGGSSASAAPRAPDHPPLTPAAFDKMLSRGSRARQSHRRS